MKLSERQKKFLRGQAHALNPVITIGDKGLTGALLHEMYGALEHHELLKIKVRVGDRTARDEIINELVTKSNAVLVTRIGNVATIYRPREKKPGIILPASHA